MTRSIAALFLALAASAASAYTNKAFVTNPFVVLSSSSELKQSPNFMSDIKDDFSGPNMMVGSPDDKPAMSPAGLARKKETSLAAQPPVPQEVKDMEMELARENNEAEAYGTSAPIKRKKYRWVTAVFWSELDLYGHTVATKK